VPLLVKKYKKTIAAVDKEYKKLERGYKDNPTPMNGVTSDEWAAKMLDHLPVVKELMAMRPDGPKYAYCLLMYLGEHAHADLEWGMKQCGWGDAGEPHQELDECMLDVIRARLDVERKGDGNGDAAGPSGGARDQYDDDVTKKEWAEADSWREVMDKRPAKMSKRRWSEEVSMRREYRQFRLEQQIDRREKEVNWIPRAVEDLKKKRKDLGDYGLDKFFTKGFDELRRLNGEDVPERDDSDC